MKDQWALSAAFYSVIIKRAAVIRSFPGEVEAFERHYQPPQKNGALFLLPMMSLDGVEHVLGRLAEAGVIPGEDVAVADMRHGPLLVCGGIEFENVADEWMAKWTVKISGELDDWSQCRAEWYPLLPRYSYGGTLDYLCVRQTSQGTELALCGHRYLAEVPQDWFDDDGQPLPEHRNPDGSLRLPSFWDGETVTGIEDHFLVGELLADDEHTVLLGGKRTVSLAKALVALDWDLTDLGELQGLIQSWRERGRA
jgi:hypothetical protein